MPEIKLTKGKVAIVSEEDFEYLNQWKWTFDRYAFRLSSRALGKPKPVRMHRAVVERMTGEPIPKGLEVDHINGKPLDNRRENLRLATISQNRRNRCVNRGGTSRYKGVCWESRRGLWQAYIYNKRSIFLGYFRDEKEAARAYDAMAKELFGEYARLNFPDE